VTRLWVLTAILFALAIAGCGPDCDKYCNKVAQCASEAAPPQTAVDVSKCILGCNESGGDHAKTIQCYIDTPCPDIRDSGHCSVTGQPPQ
jgi:hypothetical protein